MVFPCVVVVAVGAGLGGEGVVKPNRVPLGGLVATTKSNAAQYLPASLLLGFHWQTLQGQNMQTAMQWW